MRRLTGLKTLLSVDLRGLAAFRVALGTLLCVDTALRWPDLRAFYTDDGVLPVAPYLDQFANPLHLSLHLLSGSAGWQACLFALAFAAGLCLAAGYRTRTATLVGWALLVSVQNRNPLLLNGGDVLLRLLFFWALFLPLGARRSVDAALDLTSDDGPLSRGEPLYFSGATVALVLQIALVYLVTAVLKSGSEWWPDGTASYYALSLDAFTTRWGVWMKQWWDVLRLSTYVVYGLEASTALLILCPFYMVPVRLVLIGALVVMHLSFDLAMRLGIFPWVDLAALLPLVPSEAWDWVAARRGRGTGRVAGDRGTGRVADDRGKALHLAYDRECGFCRKMVRLLRELLPPGTSVGTAQADPELAELLATRRSWIVVDGEGRRHLKWDGLVTVLGALPLAGVLLRRLPLGRLAPAGDRLYDWVATHRPQLGKVTAALLPWRARKPLQPSLPATFVALFLIGLVGLWNLRSLPDSPIDVDERVTSLVTVLRLDQKWNMFAPFPLKEGGWFVLPGETVGGTRVDLIAGDGRPPRFDEPELVSDLFPNARWRKYMMSIYEKSRTDYRLYFGKYVCRSWNAAHDGPERLARFDLIFMRRLTVFPGEAAKVERIVLWQHECFGKTP